VTASCIRKRKTSIKVTLRNSRVFLNLELHDVVERAASYSHIPPPQPLAFRVWLSGGCYFVSRALRSYIITAVCYSLFLYLSYIKERSSMQLVSIVIYYVYVSFVKIMWWVWSWNQHCRWKNSPNALSVQLCEQRKLGVAIYLHLYFHSVHNLSLYTVCNSSTGWCAGRIKLLNWSERTATDHIKRLFIHSYKNAFV